MKLPEFLRFLSMETGVPSPVGVVGADPSLSLSSGTGSVSGLSSVSIESAFNTLLTYINTGHS